METKIEKNNNKIYELKGEIEALKARCETLEDRNKALNEVNKALGDNSQRWVPLYRLLDSINGCRRLIDPEKAFEEIMKVFNEVNQ